MTQAYFSLILALQAGLGQLTTAQQVVAFILSVFPAQ